MHRAAPPFRAACRAQEGAEKLGAAAALKGQKSVAGGKAPGKAEDWRPDPERVNCHCADVIKDQSTPSGSVIRWGQLPGALPPAIELIPCGDLNRGFGEAATSFSAASHDRRYTARATNRMFQDL